MRPGTSRNIGSLVLILPNSKGLLPQKISDGRSMLLGVTSLQKMCSISSCNIAVQRGGGLSGTFGGRAGRLASLERTYVPGDLTWLPFALHTAS